MAFFSVIIPLYNKEAFVATTLKSVLEQTFSDYELIIVNDGSTDGSLKKVKAFTDPRISIINMENKGVSYARNLGIEKSTGAFICFLDADDVWKPNHLEHLNFLIKTYPNCGLYCTAYDKTYFNKINIKSQYLGLEPDFQGIVPDYFHNSLINQIASGSSVAVPKALFKTIGTFDTNLRSGQDTDLWIRIALNHQVAFLNQISVTVIYSGGEGHLSTSEKCKDRVKILDKYNIYEKHNPSFKKYMDLNRFSIAIERKSKKDPIWKQVAKGIDYNNLNWKQKALLKLPVKLLYFMKRLQAYLIKQNIYLTPFRSRNAS
ncbi:MAG: glycosyltransferase family 2 protein [Algicola sp.]|nr:glycosyltransferase family 2 protein [Algicola sp.]